MSFWNLSDDTSATETGKEFDGGGGDLEPIPNGTSVLAMPDEVGWKEDRAGNEYLNLRWRVLKPEAYQNRVVYHKMWLTDDDPRAKDPAAKRDKAKRMFAAIASNAGGKLLKMSGKPDDDDLQINLLNKQMVVRLGVWKMKADDGSDMTGNFVQAVSPKDAAISEVKRPVTTRKLLPDDLDDDVPF